MVLARHIAKVKGLGYLTGAPSTGGSTTTLIDTTSGAMEVDDSELTLMNGWVKIEADSAGTPLNVGEVRRLKSEGGYVPGTSTLTWHLAMTNATTTTMTYGLYLGVPPARQGLNKGLTEYINDVLRQLRYRHYALLTLVTDGDMETSGVTNWTTSNSTATKSTTAAYITGGTQSLRVLNSSATGYVQSASVPVVEGQSYECAADVRVSSGTAILRLWDVTNAASIDTATTTELRKGFLYLDNALIPSGCKQVAVRLVGTESDADIYWDNVTLRNREAREMSLPSWFVNPKWLEEVIYTHGGRREQDSDSYNVDERALDILHYRNVIVDHTGATPYKVEFSRPPTGCHLFARCHRPYAELSTDTDVTLANQDWVRAWVLKDIFTDKKDASDAKLWAERARILHDTFAPKWMGRSFVPHRDI